MTHTPATSATPRSLVKMQLLKHHLRLLSQILWGRGPEICVYQVLQVIQIVCYNLESTALVILDSSFSILSIHTYCLTLKTAPLAFLNPILIQNLFTSCLGCCEISKHVFWLQSIPVILSDKKYLSKTILSLTPMIKSLP